MESFLTHASLHAAPILLIASLALLFAFSEAKRASGSGLRLCGAAAPGASGRQLLLAAAALSALLGGGWRVRDLVRRGSPGSPQLPVAPAVVYVPTYMPPITGPYALNLTCAKADGSRGTCSPSFCSTLTAANTLPACTGGTAALTTAVDPAAYLAKVKVATCTASTDARCSAAALSAQFSSMGSVYAAFCNAGYLVLVTSSYPGYAENLDQVVNPPKGKLSDDSECRTRSATIGATGMQTLRVTLTPKLLTGASLTNNINWFTTAYKATTDINTLNVIPLPEAGPVGFTIAGQDIFPIYNNNGLLTPEQCEADGCNAHVGQGGGEPHLHGDPFGPWCLYSAQNYSTITAHPPLIGYALDGYAIHGRHLSTDAVGYSTALDICGGHAHGSYAYHYHAQIITGTTTAKAASGVAAGQTFPAATPGVFQCFRGDLSADPLLNVKGSAADAGDSACSGSTAYYIKAGYAISGLGGSSAAPGTAAAQPAAGAGGAGAASSSSTLALGLGLGLGLGGALLGAAGYFLFCKAAPTQVVSAKAPGAPGASV